MFFIVVFLCIGIKSKIELYLKKFLQRWIKFGINYNKFIMFKQFDLEIRLVKFWYIVIVFLFDYFLLYIYW